MKSVASSALFFCLDRLMTKLILIPALFCDERSYAGMLARLPTDVRTQISIPDGDTLDECANDVLQRSPERFVIAGTSFGGHVALKVALRAQAPCRRS
jgi:hypothetical protein